MVLSSSPLPSMTIKVVLLFVKSIINHFSSLSYNLSPAGSDFLIVAHLRKIQKPIQMVDSLAIRPWNHIQRREALFVLRASPCSDVLDRSGHSQMPHFQIRFPWTSQRLFKRTKRMRDRKLFSIGCPFALCCSCSAQMACGCGRQRASGKRNAER
jgi:hypothetical protein